jgi:CubicO group peptidase (beta-lactamase class C family)
MPITAIACESARGPDADRRLELLIQFAVEGSLSGAYSQPSNAYLAPGVATPYFGYGYQVWILAGEQRRFVLIGIRGQMIFVDPASKLVMVHTAVHKQPSDRASYAEPIALWLSVVAQLGK